MCSEVPAAAVSKAAAAAATATPEVGTTLASFVASVLKDSKSRFQMAVVAGVCAAGGLAAAWAAQKIYHRIQTDLSPTLLLEVSKYASELHLRTLRMDKHTTRKVLPLEEGRVYRVSAPTWSGFVTRVSREIAEGEDVHTVDTRDLVRSPYDTLYPMPGKEKNVRPTLVFYVRKKNIPALEAFVRGFTGARTSPQLLIKDDARSSMVGRYIAGQAEGRPHEFVLSMTSTMRERVQWSLAKEVRYGFTFPDGTHAVACLTLDAARRFSGEQSQVLVLSLAEDGGTEDTSAALDCLLKGVEDIRRHATETFAVGRGVRLNVYRPSSTYRDDAGRWSLQLEPTVARPLDTLVLQPGKKESLIQDIEQFLANGERYAANGVPHRRGYLLHGPPGTGKTSLIRAVAGVFGMSLCVVNFSGLNDEGLEALMASVPANGMVVLEDLDHMFSKEACREREAQGPSKCSDRDRVMGMVYSLGSMDAPERLAGARGAKTSVTLSGLLNALDGISVGRSHIVFMSTNNLDALEESVCRPGRCDVKIHLGYATREQVRTMTSHFFPGATPAQLDEFVDAVQSLVTLTPASLQVYLLKCETVEEVLANVHVLLQGDGELPVIVEAAPTPVEVDLTSEAEAEAGAEVEADAEVEVEVGADAEAEVDFEVDLPADSTDEHTTRIGMCAGHTEPVFPVAGAVDAGPCTIGADAWLPHGWSVALPVQMSALSFSVDASGMAVVCAPPGAAVYSRSQHDDIGVLTGPRRPCDEIGVLTGPRRPGDDIGVLCGSHRPGDGTRIPATYPSYRLYHA